MTNIAARENTNDMQRIAFTMKLYAGYADEYRRRHAALWPDLEKLFKGAGIEEYSIFLEENTNTLFGYLRITDPLQLDLLPENEVMKRWWAFMKDIMETNPDNSPVSIPLSEVFYLP
jgi:L-rhamnose mutarotase